ncbi:MAG: hypothetical protein KatS3mg034_1400 [Vicingaceae bacterium]|nr:MAG: hypothetical protein KatS3mg034_1400 [Vicingaceae bacterium]
MKTPKQILQKTGRTILFQTGLIISLSFVYIAMESRWATTPMILNPTNTLDIDDWEIPITIIETPKNQKVEEPQKVTKKLIANIRPDVKPAMFDNKTDNSRDNHTNDQTTNDQKITPIDENVTNRQNIDYIETPEFLHVEVWPRHKSCKDIVENEKAKSCLEQKLYEYFEKYIDRSFPRYMQKREEKLYVEIVIDHQGKLSRFKIVKSDNEKLSELTSKAFEKLIDKHGDEFISGKNNGRQVATKFYIPIKFSR